MINMVEKQALLKQILQAKQYNMTSMEEKLEIINNNIEYHKYE